MFYTWIDVWEKWWIVTIDENTKVVAKLWIPHIWKDVDWYELQSILWDIYSLVAIEDVHSIYWMSAKSNFNFWYIKWFKVWCLPCLNVHFVKPKEWQKVVWEESDYVYQEDNPKRKDTKKTSLNAANRIFPWVDWRNSIRQKKQQDWLYDAALIAYWLKCMKD